MAIKTGQTLNISFCLKASDGTPVDADSSPAIAGKLRRNGVDQGTTVTLSKVSGAVSGDGQYVATWTQPATAAGDVFELLVSYTSAGTGYGWFPIWEDYGDILVSDVSTSSGVTLGSSQPNYAPARDGDRMDLVDAPNATAVSALQNGLATGAEISTLQSHGDASWATATGFALASVWTSGLANTIGTNLDTNVGSRSTFAGGAVASVAAAVTVGANNDKTGYALSSTGLDAIATSEPSGAVDGWNFRQRLLALFGRFFNKATLPDNGNGTLALYQRDGATSLSAQTVSDDGTTQTQGGA